MTPEEIERANAQLDDEEPPEERHRRIFDDEYEPAVYDLHCEACERDSHQ